VQEQGDGRFHFTRAQAHAAALEAGAFATARPGEAEAWLAAHEPPKGPGEETGGGGEEGGGGSGGGEETGGGPGGGPTGETPSTTVPPASTTTTGSTSPPASGGALGAAVTFAPAPRLGHLRERGSTLGTALTLSARSTVSQRATFVVAGHSHLACALPATEYEAGPVELHCPLRAGALRLLREVPLRVRVVTTVSSDSGTTTKLPRLVELRRWPTHPSSS
jgi:hypothetical protein